MSWILYVFYLSVFLFIIRKSRFFSSSVINYRWVSILFICKILGGFALWYIYSYHYSDRSSSDIFTYFDDGMIIHSSINQSFTDYLRMVTGIGSDAPHLMKYYDTCWFWIKPFNYGLLNDNRIIIRLHAIIRLFSMGNFHIHNLVFCFMSFTGLWGIYKVFESKLKGKEILLLLAVFFFPSVWFWTSGALKEAFLMFAFGMFLYHFTRMLEFKFSIQSAVWLLITVFLLLISKFYVLIAVLPGVLFLIVIKYSGTKLWLVKWVGAHLIFVILAALSGYLTGLDLVQIICNKQHDFVCYINSLNQVGSQVELPALNSGMISLIQNAPAAFFRALFRPTIFETGSLTLKFAAIENALIFILILTTFFCSSRKQLSRPWFWFSFSFVVILFTLIGLTTPILGALVRYKAPALPFLGIALLFMVDELKIISLKSRIKHIMK
jgi:hypothetical protein